MAEFGPDHILDISPGCILVIALLVVAFVVCVLGGGAVSDDMRHVIGIVNGGG